MKVSYQGPNLLRMRSLRMTPIHILMIAITLFAVVLTLPLSALASNNDESGSVQTYTWALVRWETGETVCTVKIAHEGAPTPDEIESSCSKALEIEWETTLPCPEGDTSNCQGVHLTLLSVETLTPTEGLPSPTSTPILAQAAVLPFDWLSVPSSPEGLTSTYKLSYLSGHLITYGQVTVTDCPDGGLLSNGWASECGLERVFPQALLWQNQFNGAILDTARQTGVPPYLLKNIFTRESQFWPETAHNLYDEYGLGHITTMGADSLLRWNEPFYKEICPTVFWTGTCNTTYPLLPLDLQLTLRGAVIRQIMADCPGCTYGIDLALIKDSIPIFAHTLNANRTHVERSIYILTKQHAADLVSSQDLWRFTLSSYNAGPGCFFTALYRTINSGATLDWDHLSSQFDKGCIGTIPYVDFVTDTSNYDPTGLVMTQFFPPIVPTATPTLVSTQEAAATQVVETPTDIQSTPTLDQMMDTPTAPIDASQTPPGGPSGGTLTPPAGGDQPANNTSTPTETATPSAVQSTPTPNTPIDLQSSHVEGELLVRIRPGGDTSAQALLASLDTGIGATVNAPIGQNTLAITVDPGNLAQAVTELRANPNVEFVEPNYLAQVAYTPNDPYFSQQSNLERIQVPQAWDISANLAPVLVAVIDTGVDAAHPDLAGVIWQKPGEIGLDQNGNDKRSNGVDDDGNGYVDDWQGWNTVNGNNNIRDGNGHGTHLAGIIAASMNNNEGIVGIAPNARILPIKALDATGYGTYVQIAAAIHYAVDQGARIINLGFAGEGSSQVLQDAVNYAHDHGVLMIAATGNTGNDKAVYPAAYPGVIAVGAVDNGLFWVPFSTYSDAVGLSAPGVDITSTFPGGRYNQMSGTSVASAEVTGVAALLAGLRPDATADELRAILFNTAFDLGAPGWDPYYGHGLVKAYDAMSYALPSAPTPIPTSTPIPGTGSGAWIAAPIGLWGTAQTVTGCTLTNGANSLDVVFNNTTAYCSITANGNWTYTALNDTALSTIGAVTLDARWNTTSWLDDQIVVAVSNNNGVSYTTIATYNSANPPPTTLTTINYNVSAYFTTPTQVNNALVRISWTSVNVLDAGLRVYMDEVRLNVATAALATPTIPAQAPTKVPAANDPHVNYLAATSSCAACHRDHTSAGIVLRQTWPEEQVCFTCHTTGGSGTNVQLAFTSYTNTATSFFKHDVAATNGIHRVGQNTGASFGGANRHIECEDCHEPHKPTRDAIAGTTKAPMIQPEMYYTSGVDPIWASAGAPFTFTWLPQAQREYQVCFKCHSSFTTLPTYLPDGWGWTGTIWNFIANGLPKLTTTNPSQVLDSRDMAQEFNPNSASFHPIVAKGRNTAILAAAFVNGWTVNSMMYCSDCHTNAAVTGGTGPHGSSLLHLLAGNGATPYNYITREDTTSANNIHNTGELCFKCHFYAEYATNGNADFTRFRKQGAGSGNLHETHGFSSCYACHNTHGSEQLHLINFDTSVVTISAGYNSQTAWSWNGTTGTCYITCHTNSHGTGKQYTP